MTPAQRRALESLYPRFGVPLADRPLDLPALFGRRAPVALEIGFGMGDALLAMAEADPGHDFLGVEVHRPGIGRLLAGIEARGLANVRVIEGDALQVLGAMLDDGSLDRLLLFFPDPWPKKRHHKRRLLQPEFVELAARRLALGGLFHAATDWAPYAEQMLGVLEGCALLENDAAPGGYAPRPAYRPPTRFERRGRALGHEVFDLLFRRR
ncbi:MAG: tRNA (guanosine(46)-N7)-methyltransferase TrmB [Gammaproteobacteria bacterium]|nr:tRNA (guanosine(46)-N7)-methyltransferase TrmB [Gammaproteobacteria bacterium]